MSELGQLLKQARLEKGLSLEELQDTTKIRKRYLEAIEAGEYDILPGNFYVRAFIKSYAEAVGLNPDEVLRLYKNVIPSVSMEPSMEPVHKKRKRSSLNTDRLSKWASTILMWSFLLLIAVVLYVFINQNYMGKKTETDQQKLTEQTQQVESTNDENNTSETEPNHEPTTPQEPPQTNPELSYVNTDGTTYIYNVSNTDKLEVELSTVGTRCWVLVRKNSSSGEVIEEKTFENGETQTWELDHSMWIRMGNPQNVEIRVNGHLIDREKMKESNPWNLQLNLIQNTAS